MTQSVISSGSVALISLDRWSGVTQSLDSTTLYSFANASGSFTIPYSLLGGGLMSGSELVYVTASGAVILDTSRTAKFEIKSYSNNVSVAPGGPISFSAQPLSLGSPVVMMYTSSLTPGTVYTAQDYQLNATGSSTILELNGSNTGALRLSYLWTFNNLFHLDLSNNTSLYDIGGFPSTLATMSIASCGIGVLAPLQYTALGILDCSNNPLYSLPTLPPSVVYLNCSSSPMTSAALDAITTTLVVNNKNNGYLNIQGTVASYSPVTLSNLTILTGRGWSITS